MSDFPWFPLWVDDFTNSRRIRLMSLEAIGLYTLLLCEQWKEGPIPDDIDTVAMLCGRDSDAISDAWEEVRSCFHETPGGLINKRLEKEKKKQETKRKRYQRAGRKGAETRWSQEDNSDAISDATAGPMRPQWQSESESESDKKTTTANADSIVEVFDHWKTVSGHTGCRLTADRKTKIAARLRTYSVDDLKRAIEVGCADPFYKGDNDRNKRYDFPETLLKNDSKVDTFLNETPTNGDGTHWAAKL